MSKKLVLQILQENVDHQQRAILGGIVGGEEEERFADKDLKRFIKARDYYKETNNL